MGMPGGLQRNSTMPPHLPYSDNPLQHRQSMASMGDMQQRMASPYQDYPAGGVANRSVHHLRTMTNTPPGLMGGATPRASTVLGYGAGARSSMLPGAEASGGAFDFQRGNAGPNDGMIVEAIQGVLREVDLDTVTKKQVRALVEQRLQTELTGERRTFMDRQIDNELANM